jgi:DNA polymerase III delta prime subunit
MNTISTPAQLIVGTSDQTYFYALEKLQNIFCLQDKKNKQNCFCSECSKLKKHQHSSVIWIEPEKEYVVDNIKIIFEKIRFTLEKNQNFFFVLDKAHTLNPTCANRMLKILEEPPAGYNFILLTNNENSVLPTIRSRCTIHICTTQTQPITTHPLLSFFFTPKKLDDIIEFEKTIRQQNLTNTQSTELIHQLVEHFQQQIINDYKQNTDVSYYEKVLATLKNILKKPPQSGSSNIFWKYVSVIFPKQDI